MNTGTALIDREETKADNSLTQQHSIFPYIILLALACTILLVNALLPLQGFWFHEALVTNLKSKFLLPSRLLFPGWPVTPLVRDIPNTHAPSFGTSWQQLFLLLAVLLVTFGLYALALQYLPQRVTSRYILLSTLLLGGLCLLNPIVTSTDMFSYMAYARIVVIYHHNPFITTPGAIASDSVYPYVYWSNQPSIYGPTWIAITGILQVITLPFGIQTVVPMVLAQRLFSLLMHLGSTLLIWKISGYILSRNGSISPTQAALRTFATLAFAWNPLLLHEAAVNAQNDTTLLFLVLLTIWLLVSRPTPLQRYVLAAAVFAFATCLKLNIVLLAPGLLLYMWMQRPRHLRAILAACAAYLGIIVLLYAPFWHHGALLHIFLVTPSTSSTLNSLSEILYDVYKFDIYRRLTPGYALPSPASIVNLPHTLSIALFVITYAVLCWNALRTGRTGTFSGLMRWLALVWLLYCLLGSPWFWPWYLITFFGLYALVQITPLAGGSEEQGAQKPFPLYFRTPLAIYLLSFSMLTLFCFYAWGPQYLTLPWFGFHLAYIRGLWLWALPLLALRWRRAGTNRQAKTHLLPVGQKA